ncbi:MAG: assimilatory sulfite reductase (NADPH) flavoprotein subunit [Armatimonadota bacterium]
MTPTPLTVQQLAALDDVLRGMSAVQLAWTSGYLAGRLVQGSSTGHVEASAGATSGAKAPLILFGSQTGNAKGIGAKLQGALADVGISANVSDMASYKQASLKSEQTVIIITATYGEGEPPEGAELFHKWLMGKRAPELKGLQFAVLGLGDSSYEFFNKTAQDFDSRLEALGGTRILARVELDVDYKSGADAWIADIVTKLQSLGGGVSSPSSSSRKESAAASAVWTKENPFVAELLVNQKITGRRSEKDVRHIEISLEGSGLTYKPGDALGIWFTNDDGLVTEILTITGADSSANIDTAGGTVTLPEALANHFELTQAYPGFVTKVAELTGDSRYVSLSDDKAALRTAVADRQIADILRANPIALSADQLAAALRPLQPRLYSIASSQTELPDEVHTTIAVVRYAVDGADREGGASGFIGSRSEPGDKVRVYIEPNDHFRLPVDQDTPVIMIGPGTGIAPFRAFLQERDALGATGKSWLFFGNPHFTEDFLYQIELQDYLSRGILTRLNVAFSRDQAHKIYVQDKLRKHAVELYQWIQDGAHIYICGDGQRMAKDVHSALLDIVSEQAGLDPDSAEVLLDDLRASGRYQRDVY